MSAVARLVGTCCTALPIQRWLGGIALASVALALLGFAIDVRALAGFALVAVPCYVLATAMFAGYFFRVVGAPRTHRFLPHFRGLSLAAFLLVASAATGPWLAAVAITPDGRGLPLLIPIAIFGAFLWLPFFPVAVTACALLLAAGVGAAKSTVVAATPSVTLVLVVAAAWAVAWAMFAVWYLRVPQLGALRLPQPLAGIDRRFFSDTTGEYDRGSAMAVDLTATYPLRIRHRVLTLALVALIASFVVSLVQRAAPRFPGAFITITMVFIAPLMFAPLANLAARRARLLWLKSGKSRSQLFAVTEKQLWRTSLAGAFAFLLVFCTVVASSFPVPLRTLAQALVLGLTGAAFAVYLGLLCVPRLVETAVSALLGASVLAAALVAAIAPERTDVLVSIGAVQLVGALTARAVARRRWRRIDWLVFRPLRAPFQSLRGHR